jgi:hypothetical protein
MLFLRASTCTGAGFVFLSSLAQKLLRILGLFVKGNQERDMGEKKEIKNLEIEEENKEESKK